MRDEQYDTIVIGSGGGTKIAQALEKLGIRSALIERDQAGGTCLNRGCIPSKMLIYPSGVMPMLKKLRDLKIAAGVETIDFEALVASINAYTDSTSRSIDTHYDSAEHVDYYSGEAQFTGDKEIRVGEYRLTADRIVIATGSRPLIPKIPGLEESPYMTSTEMLRNRKLPQELIVLGGGFIAAELGGAYAGFGCKVRMIVRSKMLKSNDHDILEEFRQVYDAGKVIHEQTDVHSVSHTDGRFQLDIEARGGPRETVEADALLVATGVIPNADRLGLEHTGIERNDAGFIRVNDFLETTVPGVFAMGDVAGNFLFRHSVNFEGEYWVEANLLEETPFPVTYPPMPGAVFTHPEIASVGLTEQHAREQGIEIIVGRAAYTSCTMPLARGLDHGRVKLVFSKPDGILIGAHIVGEEASTMIQESVLACTLGLSAVEMYRQVYIHPAFPEVVRNALRDALQQLDEKFKILL